MGSSRKYYYTSLYQYQGRHNTLAKGAANNLHLRLSEIACWRDYLVLFTHSKHLLQISQRVRVVMRNVVLEVILNGYTFMLLLWE